MNNNFNDIANMYELVSPKEAFDRGNLFDNLYWPYKYVSNLKPVSERDELMQKIQMYSFAAHELNLHLDIYPDDNQAVGLYNQYMEMYRRYMNEYERKYGPILLYGEATFPWKWDNSPWPWEKL